MFKNFGYFTYYDHVFTCGPPHKSYVLRIAGGLGKTRNCILRLTGWLETYLQPIYIYMDIVNPTCMVTLEAY